MYNEAQWEREVDGVEMLKKLKDLIHIINRTAYRKVIAARTARTCKKQIEKFIAILKKIKAMLCTTMRFSSEISSGSSI